MNQVEYDVQTTLPVITEMLEQEAQKTNEMSDKLVGIGETAVATTKAAVEMHQQTQQNEEHLLKVIAEQHEILNTLKQLTQGIDENHVDEVALKELQHSFAEKLDSVLSVHGADKDMIIEHISSVYDAYTKRMTELSEAINRLNNTLSDPSYQKRIDTLDDNVGELTQLVTKMGETQSIEAQKQFTAIDTLMANLSNTNVSFQQALEQAEKNRTFVASVVQRMNLIEDRLDTLIEMSQTTEKDGE